MKNNYLNHCEQDLLQAVQDVLEAAFLTNDTACLCSAFQCSHMGENPGTRIWILAPEQFGIWLSKHSAAWSKAWNSGN